MVIKQLKDEAAQTYEDVSILVGELTDIEKDYKTASLSELAAGDKASIVYTVNNSGENAASYIGIEAGE